MIILVKKEELEELLESQLDALTNIAGGPNMKAYEFDPNIADLQELDNMGYFSNRDSWITGVQIKKILSYIEENLTDPVEAAQTK